jgi:hypothetical protein
MTEKRARDLSTTPDGAIAYSFQVRIYGSLLGLAECEVIDFECKLVRPKGFEPLAPWFVARWSGQCVFLFIPFCLTSGRK